MRRTPTRQFVAGRSEIVTDFRPLLTDDAIQDPAYFSAVTKESLDYPLQIEQKDRQSFYTYYLEALAKKGDAIQQGGWTATANSSPADLTALVQSKRGELIPNCPSDIEKKLSDKTPEEQLAWLESVEKGRATIAIKTTETSQASVASSQGWHRDTNEDAHVIHTPEVGELTPAEIATVLRETVLQTAQLFDRRWFESTRQKGSCGTTLVSTLLQKTPGGAYIYTASVGDSQALLVGKKQDGTVFVQKLHKSHSPLIPAERERFYPEHLDLGHNRVQYGQGGSLSLTRAIGDLACAKDTKGAFHCSPEISCYKIPTDLNLVSARVVLTCDSVSDVMTAEEVANFVYRMLDAESATSVAEKLCYETMMNRHSADNTSVMISEELIETVAETNALETTSEPVESDWCMLTPTDTSATFLAVLDGHGSKKPAGASQSLAEQYVQEISAKLPDILDMEFKKMHFLKNQIAEIQNKIQLHQQRQIMSPIGGACACLKALQAKLEKFKMQGYQKSPERPYDNPTFSQAIVAMKAELMPLYAEAFARGYFSSLLPNALSARSDTECFVDNMIEEAKALDYPAPQTHHYVPGF